MTKSREPKESSIETLAREFIRRTQRRIPPAQDRGPFGADTVVGDGETSRAKMRSPAAAGVWGLAIWGGGFLSLGRPFWASAFLIVLLASGTLFGALSGLLPAWLAGPLLRDLHWNRLLGEGLAVTGAVFSLAWWMSVVLPAWIARRSSPRRFGPRRGAFVVLATSLLPMAGHFMQDRFRSGVLLGIGYFAAPVSALALGRIWTDSALAPLTEVARMEPYFIGFAAALLLFGLWTALAIWDSVTGAMSRVGWLRSKREGVLTEWKFVMLGAFLVILAMVYAFAAAPGDRIREKMREGAVALETRGFLRSSALLGDWAGGWERRAAPFRDRF